MTDPTTPPDLSARRAVDNMVLAVVRTELANRRTLLAYVKTALGLAIAGLGLLRFANADSILILVGLAMLPVSVIILIYGAFDYVRIRHQIEEEKRDAQV